MPRIEIVPEDWDESDEKRRGDGSPTIDLCRECGDELIEGEGVPQWLEERFGENAVIGSTEVEHPSYEDDEYNCEHCGCELDELEDC